MERRPGEQVTRQASPPPPQSAPSPVVPPPTQPTPSVPKGGPPIGLIVGGIVLAVAAVIVLVVLLSGGEEKEPEEKPAEAKGIDLRFNRIPPDEAVFGGDGDQAINRLSSTEDAIFGVGYSDTPIGDKDAAVWTSTDGAQWSRLGPDPEVFGGSGDQEMWAAVPGGPGLVVVGSDGSEGDLDAAVWLSDGVAFERVEHREGAFGGVSDQVMLRVSKGGPGLIAVGFDTSGGDRDAAVWTSKDGRKWARSNPNEAVFGGDGDQVMRSTALVGSRLVGVGDDTSGGDLDAAAWISDGNVFSRVFSDETVFGGQEGQRMFTVVPGGPGVIGVGTDSAGGDEDAAVWTSTNGQVWERIPADELIFGGEGRQVMNAIAGNDEGFVAVGKGSFEEDPLDQEAQAWQSLNGTKWRRISPTRSIFGGEGEQEMKFVTVAEGLAVAAGWDGSGGDLDAAVWTAKFPRAD